MIARETFEASVREFLRPLGELLGADDVSEILINTCESIFVERGGRLERSPLRLRPSELEAFLRVVSQYAGRPFDEANPILEAHLPDGSRLEAIAPPLVLGGPHVAIRRHRATFWTLARLQELGAVDEADVARLRRLVRAKRNIVVAGGTGTGKTSVLSALAAEIPSEERIVVIEDAREIQLSNEHALSLQSRAAVEDGPAAVAIRDLFRATLRMRPDRVVIGEIRGGEALDLLLAMTSGHGGCLSTVHASSPRHALERLETLSLMAGLALPLEAARRLVGAAIGAVVQVERSPSGRRFVSHVSMVEGFSNGEYQLSELSTREENEHG